MNAGWPLKKLRDVADIRISSVDKKVVVREKPIKLCNYMDVYVNEYVTGSLLFMEASATSGEIERFGLNPGDVIITKDSETPDDIGVPAVVTEAIPDLVCGYHLALIRSNPDQVNPIYLAKQLETPSITRYFARNASGSTRYGLPVSTIESTEIPIAPLPEQAKIAEILLTVDRAIQQTEALIAKQQRIKTGLVQNLLTRGIDEQGNLRSEQTHKFKESLLGKVPADWEVVTTGQVCTSLVPGRSKPHLDGGSLPWITIPDLIGLYVDASRNGLALSLSAVKAVNARVMPKDTVLMSCVGQFGLAAIANTDVVANQQLHGFVCSRAIIPEWLVIQLISAGSRIDRMATQTTIKYLNKTGCESILIAVPPRAEQERGVALLSNVITLLSHEQQTLNKLRSVKTALMQDLLTGRKPVTPLLTPTEDTPDDRGENP